MPNAQSWEKRSIEPKRDSVRTIAMTPIIVWFRQDFRLSDNPALTFAAKSGKSYRVRMIAVSFLFKHLLGGLAAR